MGVFSSLNIREPIARSFSFALSDRKECTLNFLGDLSTPAAANSNTIDRANRGNLSSRPREEQFVGHVKCCALNAPFLNSDAQLLAYLDHAVASYARENR